MNATLPTVTWNGRTISRVLIGHNPFKGQSHHQPDLDAAMKDWFTRENSLAVLRRAEECGITTCQFGAPYMHDIMRAHKAEGGNLQWISTMYCNEKGDLGLGEKIDITDELEQILAVDPAPIGIQHFGESTDLLFLNGRIGEIEDRLKMVRDKGLLVGVCTHLPQVIEELETRDFDLDFYQTCFYTVYSGDPRGQIDRQNERFEDEDRDRMIQVIQNASKPCLAFKVLGANRKCSTTEDVQAALKLAFDSIKDTDVVCLGMWQKYRDQVAENCEFIRNM